MRVTLALLLSIAPAAGQAPPPPARNGDDCGSGITCYGCLDEDMPVKPVFLQTPPSCTNTSQLHYNTCLNDHPHRIKQTTAASPDDCCGLCSKDASCVAWNHWDGTSCNLFSSTNGAHSGDCVSGYSGISPSPGPSPTPPPPPVAPPGPACKDCPNIVLMFTDDQDLVIGGWDDMHQTKELIQKGGAYATNWTIHTPICAPSRSELMSGRYFHNIKNLALSPPGKLCGSGAVGHIDLENKVYPFFFANQLRVQKGYHTGLFGKCMNGGCENPASMNGAIERWFEGTNYQGGSFYDNESPDNKFVVGNYSGGYGTSVIGNKTIEWLKNISNSGRPFFVYFAPHAPHSPATPAPWYADACPTTKSPRTPAYNYTSPLFHNLVSRQPPLDDDDATKIDELARKRCQTLLSVDDSYAGIYKAVEELGKLNNTYFLVSSDHGYNLGQHRLPSNKFLLYDHSLRIPQLFSGPGIPAGFEFDFRGTQVDIAPTILGFAGIATPSTMDGNSIVSLLVRNPQNAPASVRRHLAVTSAPNRSYSFHEYYNQGPWEVGTRHALDDWSNTYIGLSGVFEGMPGVWKYAEYDPYGKQSNFSSVYLYELFNLDTDPYELNNVYTHASSMFKAQLHSAVRRYYECAGDSCP